MDQLSALRVGVMRSNVTVPYWREKEAFEVPWWLHAGDRIGV